MRGSPFPPLRKPSYGLHLWSKPADWDREYPSVSSPLNQPG